MAYQEHVFCSQLQSQSLTQMNPKEDMAPPKLFEKFSIYFVYKIYAFFKKFMLLVTQLLQKILFFILASPKPYFSFNFQLRRSNLIFSKLVLGVHCGGPCRFSCLIMGGPEKNKCKRSHMKDHISYMKRCSLNCMITCPHVSIRDCRATRGKL